MQDYFLGTAGATATFNTDGLQGAQLQCPALSVLQAAALLSRGIANGRKTVSVCPACAEVRCDKWKTVVLRGQWVMQRFRFPGDAGGSVSVLQLGLAQLCVSGVR